VDFSLSKEQRDIKRAAREFAEGEFTPERAMELDLNHEFSQNGQCHTPFSRPWSNIMSPISIF